MNLFHAFSVNLLDVISDIYNDIFIYLMIRIVLASLYEEFLPEQQQMTFQCLDVKRYDQIQSTTKLKLNLLCEYVRKNFKGKGGN